MAGYGYGCENVKWNVGCGEKRIGRHESPLLATGATGETQSDRCVRYCLRCLLAEQTGSRWAFYGCCDGNMKRDFGFGKK